MKDEIVLGLAEANYQRAENWMEILEVCIIQEMIEFQLPEWRNFTELPRHSIDITGSPHLQGGLLKLQSKGYPVSALITSKNRPQKYRVHLVSKLSKKPNPLERKKKSGLTTMYRTQWPIKNFKFLGIQKAWKCYHKQEKTKKQKKPRDRNRLRNGKIWVLADKDFKAASMNVFIYFFNF